MIGPALGHFRILEEIGSGGMGVVYRGLDVRLGRTVAIKVLQQGTLADAERRERLAREARAASALNHPNIVTIYEIGSEAGVDFIAMELIEGQSLRKALGPEGVPLRAALSYAIETAHALAAAHEKGIVHRDLKPENLLTTKEGRIKVLDFGLAKLVRDDERVAMLSSPQRRQWRRNREPSWGPRETCRPSRYAAGRSTSVPISFRSAPSSTRC